MTYNIRYLAIFIGNIKFCNVRYILSYQHRNMELYTRNTVKYSFFRGAGLGVGGFIPHPIGYLQNYLGRSGSVVECLTRDRGDAC